MYSTYKPKFKQVVNKLTLDNFDRYSGNTYDTVVFDEVEPVKQIRDPKRDKDRDMRKLSKKDRWDD